MEAQWTVGRRLLLAWRTEKGWSQREACDGLALKQATLSALELGVRKPGLRLAIKLRDECGIPIEAWNEPAEAAAAEPAA